MSRHVDLLAGCAILLTLCPNGALADAAVQFTTYPESDQFPAWSPDGTEIAFTHGESFAWDIWVKPTEGGDARILVDDAASETHPAWSPDGSTIAYERALAIWTVSASGGTGVPLTDPTGANDSDHRPDWSPDGSLVAFSSRVTSDVHEQIFTARATGNHELRITIINIPHYEPTWSPDGSRIAYRFGPSLYVVDVDTNEETPLVPGALTYHDPDWSPDGSQIVFWTDGDIYTVSIPDGSVRQITDDPALDSYPAWSPDGTRIVFQSLRSGNNDIWIIALDDVPVLDTSWGQIKARYH